MRKKNVLEVSCFMSVFLMLWPLFEQTPLFLPVGVSGVPLRYPRFLVPPTRPGWVDGSASVRMCSADLGTSLVIWPFKKC